MTDNTELKRLADELIAANDLFNESPQDNEAGDVWSLANDRFTEAASPEVILALIADNDRLESEAVYAAAGFDAAREEVARLKAENEALRKALTDLLDLYDTDEGCRGLPQYIAGRAAMGKGEKP